ncbi:MAG: cyclase family protein [Actinobacteria bacterium]|nr:cyclase family protein [Actinomycetota bacterium]
MRIPDPPFAGWQPPSYTVSTDGKVSDAEPGTPNNWGRWGDDDQIGTANLSTADAVRDAASLITSGRRFSLAVPIGTNVPSFRPVPLHLFGSAAADGVVADAQPVGDGTRDRWAYSDDILVLAPQYSTQLDGFGLAVNDTMYNGYWAGLVTAHSGARRLGMHHRTAGIVGRGVLLDVARHIAGPASPLPHRFRISTALLEETAAAQGVEVRPGDVLLVRTGYLAEALGGGDLAVEAAPGLAASTIPWLHERDIMLVGTDTPTIEVVGEPEPGHSPNEFHFRALRDLGLQLAETLTLDELAADCQADGRYEFFFAAAPLPVTGGVGSPLNPLAIK